MDVQAVPSASWLAPKPSPVRFAPHAQDTHLWLAMDAAPVLVLSVEGQSNFPWKKKELNCKMLNSRRRDTPAAREEVLKISKKWVYVVCVYIHNSGPLHTIVSHLLPWSPNWVHLPHLYSQVLSGCYPLSQPCSLGCSCLCQLAVLPTHPSCWRMKRGPKSRLLSYK